MPTTIQIPDFDFSKFYYAQLLEALTLYKRRNVPEHTDENPYDGYMQFLRMQSLVGHLNNTLIDLTANESTIVTAKLAETVRNQLRLIDYKMATASPAQAAMVYELSKVFTKSTQIISAPSLAATKKQGDVDAVNFEVLDDVTIDRTDQFTKVYGVEGGVFSDFTDEANSPTTPADDWQPWAAPAAGDALYFGHNGVMWNQLGFTLTTPGAGLNGVWEYYDGNFFKTAPTGVTDNGATLEFDLTGYLGSENRAGQTIRVQLNETTAFEDVVSTWDGSKNIATTGLLGQTSPSTDPTEYTIGAQWEALPEATDGTQDLTQTGAVAFTLPRSVEHYWKQGTVEGVEAFWIRYRLITVSTPTAPTIQRARLDEEKQFATADTIQGETKKDNPLGSSTGLASQKFETTRDHYVNGSMVAEVEGVEWLEVDSFLGQLPNAAVFVVKLGENNRATVVFGDGNTGKIPPLGVGNVSAAYRIGGSVNGNVGAGTITNDKAGLSFVNKIWNPQQAAGWAEAEGASTESLEQAKERGPATLRVKEVALSPDDAVELTQNYTDENASKPFSRARAFEEGFGPKTVELTLVASGGGLATADQIEDLETYFNGDPNAYPPKKKRFVANQKIVAVNYTQREIDVDAVVYGDVDAEEITNRLRQVIQPEALKDDGITWEWEFGAEVPDSRISAEIFKTNSTITKVEMNTPDGSVFLQPRELPVLGNVSIVVVKPE